MPPCHASNCCSSCDHNCSDACERPHPPPHPSSAAHLRPSAPLSCAIVQEKAREAAAAARAAAEEAAMLALDERAGGRWREGLTKGRRRRANI